MSVNELEALWFDKKHAELGREYLLIIRTAIREERKANTLLNILLRIAAVLLILAGICVVIAFINKVFKKITAESNHPERLSVFVGILFSLAPKFNVSMKNNEHNTDQ